jgi:hypothetical protein
MARMMTPPGAPDTDNEAPGLDATDAQGQDTDLDTAATAKRPQVSDPDADTFASMVAGLRKYLFGPGEQGVVDALQHADDPGRVLGEVVFSLVQEAVKQSKAQNNDMSMDILLGVATELIDDITELMDAHGMQLSQKDREYGLLYAQQLYVQNYNPTDDDREAAKAQLGQFQKNGALDTAVSYVQQRGAEAGADPFGVSAMPGGADMMGGK